jgi:hypothetical protein
LPNSTSQADAHARMLHAVEVLSAEDLAAIEQV